jgi:hypothetical protein
MFTREALQQLRSTVRGSVLTPGDANYEATRRVFNAMIDRRPGVIVRCASTSDIVTGIRFAREHAVPISIRGGGHRVAGNGVCDDGVMLDLETMKAIRGDESHRTARAEPGLRLGEFDDATQRHGLATPLGIASDTGIAGLTLGGGLGWLNGRFGLSCDKVLSFEVVTADAQILTVFPFIRAREVLRACLDLSEAGPDELSTIGALLTLPDGTPVVAVAICYCGSVDEGTKAIAPVRGLGSPLLDAIQPIPYVAQQRLLDDAFPPKGHFHYWKSSFTRTMSDDGLEGVSL